MSVGISIQFLAGRYHATPWDHQVNEGVVEFPPSPWRILRALVAAYYHLPNPPDRAEVCQLLTQLATDLPSYRLPASSAAHTRHYMPTRKEGKKTTTRVFDTFLVLGRGALSPEARIDVTWDSLELTSTQAQLLQQLCGQVGYLGRAESWADLSVHLDLPRGEDAIPLTRSVKIEPPGGGEQVKLLAPLDESGLAGFQAALSILPRSKKAKWKVPADVLQALELDVGDLHAQGWSGIPGTRWVTYQLAAPTGAKALPSPIHPVIFPELNPPTFARFALVAPVLPSLTQAVSIGERFHRALVKWSDSGSGADSVFTGKDVEGKPLQGNHAHAWYLPEDADGDGKIDHVIVYAPQGFKSKQAIKALSSLASVWSKDDREVRLQTVLVALGQSKDYGAATENAPGQSLLVGASQVWRSLTPVVLSRFPKCNRRGEPKLDSSGLQIDSPEQQVRRYLGQLGFDSPRSVEFISESVSNRRRFQWQEFQRQRPQGQGAKSLERGYGFELTFEQPQHGPMALGYAAHYGLGLFVPVSSCCAEG